uniref:Calpain catalytic domain-containing protein n=1 Tax=Strigamia maritima TaxID=126957 RepID=T1IN91_STRMM
MLNYFKNTFLRGSSRLYDQNYADLKKQCQERGVLFDDPHFPPTDVSMFFSEKGYVGQVQWKRPKDLSPDPHLFVDGISSLDASQGQLGNCWFIAACSVLAQEKELWNKVIPNHEEQEWDSEHPEKYCGIFCFRFWRFGKWMDVVIDDYLPTINGELVYAHSYSQNEFWMALLEKAYAKIHGTYEALDGGNLCDALVDFTSGFAESISLPTYRTDEAKRAELYQYINKEFQAHSLMCSAISITSAEEMEARTEVGLVKGHAYGVTNVKKVNVGESSGLLSFFKEGQKLPMLRLRNPWGQKEWNGPFSDGMTFDDFCTHFTDLSICHLINTSWFSFTKTWCEGISKGIWVQGAPGSNLDRAGGCVNNKDSFLRNPQQKDAREKRHEGISNLPIGFQVMKVELNRKYRLHTFKEMMASSEFIRTRNVFLRCTLPRGRYVVFPTTFEPGQEGEFIIRIFSSTINALKEMKKEVPSQGLFNCAKPPIAVTEVVVHGAVGLSTDETIDPYAIVKCEGKSVRTPTVKDSTNPIWKASCIFYRRDLAQPITIEIWNNNKMMDAFLGKADFPAPINEDARPVMHDGDLQAKNPETDPKPTGKLAPVLNINLFFMKEINCNYTSIKSKCMVVYSTQLYVTRPMKI